MWQRLFFISLCWFGLLSNGYGISTNFIDTQGNQIDFAAKRDKPLILVYWADWCHYCIKRIPQFNAFYKDHRQEILMYGVHRDGLSGGVLQQMVKQHGFDYPVLEGNPTTVLGLKSINKIPAIVIISAGHKVLPPIYGFNRRKLENALMQAKSDYYNS